MKKISMILGGAILILAAGCQKLGEGVASDNTDAPQEGGKVELFASLPVTRTILSSDFKLSWNKNDQIAVFNAPAGTEGYSGNIKFVNDDDATGKFSPVEGAVVPFADGVNYDWFVCCPYRILNGVPELKTPKGETADDGYFPIGAQTQTGYNNTTHIGGVDVMVGKAINTRTPNVALKHLAVLHKFTVTNNSDKPTVITKLTLNGGENKLFGTFRLDLRSDNPVISVDNANNTYAERALTVNNGTELPVGESADFYMMTAPFTLNTDETFTVTIETTTGTQVVAKTATKDIEFVAGTYNTASLVYDYIAPDYLYLDTFDGKVANDEAVSSTNSSNEPGRWTTYDKAGMSVYDSVVSNVNYKASAGKTTLSRLVSNKIVGMNDLYAWLATNASFDVSGIKLYGHSKLSLSYLQTYPSSGLKIEYSVDGGEEWCQIGTSVHPNANSVATYSHDFVLSQSYKTISLRFTATAAAPRIDNIKLTWQAE